MTGIWLLDYGPTGVATSMTILVAACAREPVETFERRAVDWRVPLTHGLAETIVENGCDEPLLFCRPCARAWHAEAARLARWGRLPPAVRTWLSERGLCDWPVATRAQP